MVTLNKPAAGNTSWYAPVTDNWTAIESSLNNLVDQATSQGRLTLSSNNPVYNPMPRTPSATDTFNYTVDFSSPHGWTTGTMATPNVTVGGLTAGTTYYLRAVDADTVSFHTTLANAESGASKVVLSASITSLIQPLGVASTTAYFTPYRGNRIAVHDGSGWKIMNLTQISLALGSLAADKNYDVFIYDNSGSLALETVVWSTDTARVTDLALQDGIYVKSGSTTRRYIGTLRTLSSSACEDSLTKRYLWNYWNREPRKMLVSDPASSWGSAAGATWASANASTANRVQVVVGVNEDPVEGVAIGALYTVTGAFQLVGQGVGLDSTTVNSADLTGGGTSINNGGFQNGDGHSGVFTLYVGIGFHFLQWLEWGGGSMGFYGTNGTNGTLRTGLKAIVRG